MIPKAICIRTGMAPVNIAWVETGEFTSTQKGELADIAFQCPLSGGDAVFFARSLYALIDSDAGYDDELLCSVGQHFAIPAEKPIVPAGFFVYPNPAGDIMVFVMEPKVQANVLLEIFHTSGYLMKRQEFDAHDGQFYIETGNMLNGMYICRLSSEGRSLGSQKVIISK
ncbi:MAG: T9SS type A sorting domain-containing protein [Saprospiraceae bacterium]|nr:T9SS type A sorting domain-containing protein [Saprospiraceae bacterium]